MKTEISLKSSVEARIKDVEKLSNLIRDQATRLRYKKFDKHIMSEMRENLNKLNQAVHEYSAYRNALETD